MDRLIASLVVLLLATIGGSQAPLAQSSDTGAVAPPVRYKVTAGDARVNRRVTGVVTETVQGVPAAPVDSFVYDGNGSTPVEGHFRMILDPAAETGRIQASWSDEHGDWTYLQQQVLHPEHWSGVRMGASVNELTWFLNEGATTNVYIHGDTAVGFPVLPTLFAYVATWGPAEVTLNGEIFANVYEVPAPLWLGHAMVTEGVRHPDGTVRTLLGDIYSPAAASDGALEPGGDLEVHLVFHDERFPMTASHPALFSFFYHLVFEDVQIQITQATPKLPQVPVDDGTPASARESGLRKR